jgi:hypothetical protein
MGKVGTANHDMHKLYPRRPAEARWAAERKCANVGEHTRLKVTRIWATPLSRSQALMGCQALNEQYKYAI